MADPLVLIERDHPGEHDPAWLERVRGQASERIAAFVPPRYTEAVADNGDVQRWVQDVVSTAVHGQRGAVPSVRRGPSMLLLGPTGVGKTYQAYGALHALAVSGVQCSWIFTTAADLYARLRPRQGADTEIEFHRYADSPLLVLDDLGAAKASEWIEEINYRLINHRYEHLLPTLITSNVPASDLGAQLGERVKSRLTEMAERVAMVGQDRRSTPKE